MKPAGVVSHTAIQPSLFRSRDDSFARRARCEETAFRAGWPIPWWSTTASPLRSCAAAGGRSRARRPERIPPSSANAVANHSVTAGSVGKPFDQCVPSSSRIAIL